MKYRREIDGLRAVAVLPVILFHAGFNIFSGGYVGVDVFFVISGYLITSILIGELEQGKFSIVRFYERRARRILPALFFVMLACLPFAYMWMLPPQLKEFAQSLVAVVFFVSNIFYFRESGYFAAAAELKPLLHTWSLAVEEQYYLIFPIFLLLVWRFGRNKVFWSVVFIAAMSLLLAEWGWRNAPSANFYLAPTRAWELLAGSICAFLTLGRSHKSNNVLSVIGLAAIVFSIFAFDENTPFPSAYALVPVVGTALIIVFGRQGTWVAKLLSMRAFVAVGLISYSAYLWHQPLFAFARLRSLTEPNYVLMAALAVAALLLAWATWYWVEQPFRKPEKSVLVTRRGVFAASGTAGAVFVAFGLAGHVGEGYPSRLSDAQLEIITRSKPVWYDCDGRIDDCFMGDIGGEFTGVAFIGDSHVGRYAYLLNEILAERGANAQLVTRSWCAPLLFWQSSVVKRCGGGTAKKFERAFVDVLKNPDVHTVVLSARWANFTTGYSHLGSPIAYDFREDGGINESVDRNAFEFALAFDRTLDELNATGKRVIVIGPAPEYNFNVPNAALRLSRLGAWAADEFQLTRYEYEKRNGDVLDILAANLTNFTLIDVWPIVCSEQRCLPFTEDGFALYNDGNHLLREGMKDIVAEIIRVSNL